ASRADAMGATWYDAGSTLAFVAGATTRIALLSHVLVLPYRHPLVVAKQYGTLDHLSGGRLILGVGSGHLKPEFAVLGAAYARAERATTAPLELVAPLAVAPDAASTSVVEQAGRWLAAGATSFHVGLGARSLTEFLERVAWFAREVMPQVG